MSAFSEYWRVFRLHMRMQLGLSSLSGKGRKRPAKETAKLLGFGALILYAVGAILSLYALILYPLMESAAEAAEAGINLLVPLMGVIVLLCMALVLVLGTLTLLSVVFGAKDAEAYAALPLREQSVFAAKFSVAYGIELAATALLFWPAAVIYGIVTDLSAPAFIFLLLRALPIWLLLPMIPMALAALISLLFTRLTALTKRRDLLLVIFGMVFVFGMVIGQSALTANLAPTLGDAEAMERLLTDNSALLEAVTRSFPPAMWASQALLETNVSGAVIGFFGLLASAAFGGAFCLLLSRRLYYKGVLAQMEAPGGIKKGYKQDSVKAGGALGAFFSKEIKIILRTPVYAMNILVGVAFFPIMLAVLSFGGGAEAADMLALLSETSGDIKYLLAAAVVMLTSVMASTSVSTTFSREGRMLWLSQTAPVPARTQLMARLSVGFALAAAGAALSLAVLVIFVGFTAAEAVFGMAAGLCASVPILVASVIPDALKPKRKWNSEAEAMKQNLNSLLSLLICAGVAAAIGFAAFLLLKLNLPVWMAGAAVSALCVACGVVIFGYASRITENMMKTVDG